jgi:hypothetical protein
MKPFISTTVFGFINYVAALLLISSPWLFEFSHVGGASLFLPILLGWLQLIMQIFSDNSFGFMKVFPIQIHLTIDVFAGSFLLVLPWLYDFSAKVFWPHLLFGSLFFLLGIFTDRSPILTKPHHSLGEAGITSIDSHEGRLNV